MSIEAQSNDEIQDKSIDAARRFFASEEAYRQALQNAPAPTTNAPIAPEVRLDLLPPPQASQQVEGIAPPVEFAQPATPPTEFAPVPQRSIREIYESKIKESIEEAKRSGLEPVLDGKPLIQALTENGEFTDRPRLQRSLIEYAQSVISGPGRHAEPVSLDAWREAKDTPDTHRHAA